MDTASESVFGMLRKAKVVQLKGYIDNSDRAVSLWIHVEYFQSSFNVDRLLFHPFLHVLGTM